MNKFIHLLGHNDIIINLSKTLISENIAFMVYSNQPITSLNSNFTQVDDLLSLKQILLKDISNSLFISAGAPWIMDKEFLEAFEPNGIFNIHGTALPTDRGGTVISWLIMNRKRLGNSIIHKMVNKPDAGPILLSEEFIYPIECHYPQDYLLHYNQQQEKLVTKLCLIWAKQEIDLLKTSEQPHYLSTYWPRLKTNLNAWINWSWTGNDIELFVRAFDEPYMGALTTWRGKQVHLKKCFFQHDAHFHPFQFGLVCRVRKTDEVHYLAIAVEGGTLYCEDCKDENGNSLMNNIKEGDRFQTTDSKLFEAQKRTVKTKQGLSVQSDF
jgi:methionyl-tRNA formyltransferase